MKHVSTGKGKGEQDHAAGGTGASHARSRSAEAKPSLQSAIGNREFAGLFRETVGPRNDSFEREADEAARTIASAGSARGFGLSSSPGGIQRQCAECEHEEEEKIRRAPKDEAAPETAAAAPEAVAAPEAAVAPAHEEAPAAQPEAAAGPSLLVEDADTAGPGQMGKTQFLTALRAEVTAAADAALAGTGQTSEGCPWIDYWLGYYADQSASHLERALRKYAPEAAGAESASDYFAAVTARTRRSVLIWSTTGEVTGVPEGVPGGGSEAGAASVLSKAGGMFFKARPGGPTNANPASVRDQLGSGGPLPGSVRSRMESAFGSNFGGVRLHTDGKAAQLSDQLNARAFTVGEHVAFGPGEYHPGTIAGDALMAHELAHVVQQGGAKHAQPRGKSPESTGPLEHDADRAAARAVASLWGGVKGGLASLGPSLKSGLQLSRCGKGKGNGKGKKAKLKSGPTYTPGATIKATKSGGTKSASFKMSAEFEKDLANGIDPSCGEIRQYIKWTKAADLPNHAGFTPKSGYSENTWYEDRDSAGKRYGHRSGTYSECVSINQYQDTKGTQDCVNGEVFVGQDDPMDGSGAKTGEWNFELRAVDACDGEKEIGTPATVTVDWNV